MSILFLAPLLVAAATPPAPVRFDCAVALATPQGQLTAPAPVTISFVTNGTSLSEIHVIDEGGILYPGGNMRVVKKPDAISIEAVALPPERPGVWKGSVEKKLYRLTLQSGSLAMAVEIGLSRKPDKRTGRFGLVWNATNQPDGMPGPISGSGIGNCAMLTGANP